MQIQKNAKREPRTFAPPVDVFENADEILIVADVPGVPNDAIHVNLHASELTLEARRNGEILRRTFQVSSAIESDRIEANAQDGVLRVRIPKRAEVKPRRIEVK